MRSAAAASYQCAAAAQHHYDDADTQSEESELIDAMGLKPNKAKLLKQRLAERISAKALGRTMSGHV